MAAILSQPQCVNERLGIQLRTVSEAMPKKSIMKICMKTTHLKLFTHLPVATVKSVI